MKAFSFTSIALFLILAFANELGAACGDTYSLGSESTSGACKTQNTSGTLTKSVAVTIHWLDGYQRSITVSDRGQAGYTAWTSDCARCWPEFHSPYWVDDGTTAYWHQKTYAATINVDTDQCSIASFPTSENRQGHTCRCGEGFSLEWPECTPCSQAAAEECINSMGQWREETCYCDHSIGPHTPVLIDINGDGFDLTDAARGVLFDLNTDGIAERIAWTSESSDDAFIVLDRNGNGSIDNGAELFGDATPQPNSEEPNGFLALAEFDREANGGNGDGKISVSDSVFADLRLWQDRNHSGRAEPEELHGLTESGLSLIELAYRTSGRRDEYGNYFRYRAKVRNSAGAQLGRWAWDVFLVSQ